MLAIFQQIGLPEIILILAVLLLLFGARKLPELARSLGRSTKEFKQGMRDGPTEAEEAEEEPETTQPASEKPE
jgi:sec-independent protein translocase protein TatA